jgi:t-SNARE complex subunit (syntaxin)
VEREREGGYSAGVELSIYMRLACRVSASLRENETLIAKLEKLTGRKEFSNDPSAEISDMSAVVQKNMNIIQGDLKNFKACIDEILSSMQKHQQQHYTIILQHLSKQMTNHMERYKNGLKTHSENMKARQQRVNKYGIGAEQVQLGVGSMEQRSTVQSYAMFAQRNAKPQLSNGPLHRRNQKPEPVGNGAGDRWARAKAGGSEADNRYPPNSPSPGMANSPHSDHNGGSGANGNGSMSLQAPTYPPGAPDTPEKAQEMRRRGGKADTNDGSYVQVPSQAYGEVNGAGDSSPSKGKGGSSAGGSMFGGLGWNKKAGGTDTHYKKFDRFDSSRARPANTGGYMQQVLMDRDDMKVDAHTRMKGAQQIERAVAQLGELFTQMSSLVLQQGETIQRIEDDVEIGVENTAEAHKSMERFYEISKGNRSMIFKIFGLLIFFIVLFLVWT